MNRYLTGEPQKSVDLPCIVDNYKLEFIRRRWLQTVFGGLRVSDKEDLAWYSSLWKIILYIFTPIIALTMTLLAHVEWIQSLCVAICISAGNDVTKNSPN